MRIYLDVETYRLEKGRAFVDEYVIVVGVIEGWTPYSPESCRTWSGGVRFRYFAGQGLGVRRG